MNFSAVSLPASLLWICWGLSAGVLVFAFRSLDWSGLSGQRVHYWAGITVMLSLAWSLHGALAPGFDLHLIGATLAVLMFGLPLALLSLLFALTAATLNGGGDWFAFALNWLSAAYLPALVSAGWLRWTQRRLPLNYFVFLFVSACFGAVLGVFAVGLAATAVLAFSGIQPLDSLLSDYSPFFILLAFAEAWLTGMFITLMVIWRPGWVASFDDAKYLRQQ